jgi:hypothetical protein
MIKHVAIFLICPLLVNTSARAEETSTWRAVGEWTVLIDQTDGNSCLMEKKFDDGTLVQFGALPKRNGGFLAAYNPDWTDVEDGATGTIKFEFPNIRFVGDVVGVAKNGRFGGYAFFDNPNVVLEFSRSNDMTLLGELGRKIEVNLRGTSNAIKAVKACQAEQPE